LSRGAWVISDRFADSTRAYQGIGLGLGVDAVDNLYRLVAPDFEPDFTLLLDLPVEAGLARVAKRGGMDDRYQQKNTEFHRKLRDAYLSLAKKYAGAFSHRRCFGATRPTLHLRLSRPCVSVSRYDECGYE
jgi:dTMP kinase